MATLAELHPAIQYAVLKLSNPDLSFEQLGGVRGVSRQAVQKQVQRALHYLRAYAPGWEEHESGGREAASQQDASTPSCHGCTHKNKLIQELKLSLILAGVRGQLLKFFRAQVLKFFPRFKVTRLPPEEKKQILDWLAKYRREGGLIKDFAREVGRSPETLARWQEAYDKLGLAGLADKSTRPKNFGNKVPLWVRDQLILLFLQFPRWTPYQYHSFIRHSPTTHWYVSLPVIQQLKNIHMQRSLEEKERIAKRWCFAPGTDAWSVDFTCILKTEHFKLQCLTVSDQRSRFLLHSALYLNTSTDAIIRDLEELFIKYGKPLIIKADNGPEYRMEFREGLRALSVYLLNSPQYYGQFNGAHERIHRTMKTFIDPFETHQNITRLVAELAAFQDQYNYKMPMDSLGGKTPAEIFLGNRSFTPKGAEVVTPYEKEGELRMKFTNRDGNPGRMSMPVIEPGDPTAPGAAAPPPTEPSR
jgi:putative transposase